MPNWWQDKPVAIAIAILFVIVLLRAEATYWVGRGIRSGARRGRRSAAWEGPRVTVAVERLHRWGPPLIPLSFLTVGFQTVVNAAAGITGMSWPRYTAWMLPGALAWAGIYATVGFAVVEAALGLGGWLLPALGALVVVGGVTWWFRRRAARTAAAPWR